MNTFKGPLRLWTVVALFSISLVCFVYLVPFSSTQAYPNCTGGCQKGYEACYSWCDAHNKKTTSILRCYQKCTDYWLSGKNPQSIGPGDPAKPPRKGPGNISGLPVSNPTPTPRKGPGKIGTTGIGKASPTPSPKGPVLLEKSGKASSTPRPTPRK